ncbi:MAG: sodium:solute symporter [Acidobacteriota bacterium]|nr:sodium:solute symporter [Acidobacteriota bacterium]
MDFQLEGIDLAMVGLYTLFIIWIGFYIGSKTKSSEDYFLAGRSLTWWLIGFSLFATNMSSTSLIGLAGSAYGEGIAVYNYEWMAAVVLAVFVIFFLPFYIRTRVSTVPEYFERRFDQRSRYYFSTLTIVGNIFIDTAGSLYAGGLVIQLVYPQIPLWQAVTALAVVAGLYTVAGGLKAVVYTDAIQAVLLLIGAGWITVQAYSAVGSWDAVTAVTPPEMLSLIKPADDPFLPWTGLLIGVPMLGFYFWCNNQFMVQRVLGAKSLEHGRWGALFAGFLKLPVILIMVLPGTMARVLYPDLERADMVYPTMMFDLLPVGLRGLVLTALLAAIMSSIDSTLNSASTLVTMDFVKKLRPKSDNRFLVWTGRLVTFIFMVVSALWAPQILKFPSLWQYLQSVLAYLCPPIVACFLIGTFWRRANATGAFVSLIAGHVVSLILLLMGTGIHYLIIPGILFIISGLVLVLVSLATAEPDAAKVEACTWTAALYREDGEALRGLPWYRNYRLGALVLLVITAVVVIAFR